MAMLVLPDVFERTWGRRRGAVLAPRDAARAGAGPGLRLHGRGVLGPRVDDATARLRLRVRQAALRPPARGACAAGARALPRRARLPGQARPLPGEPRRAARGGRVRGRACTRPRPCSRSSRRGCASSTRASSRAGGSASRRTWCARPHEPVDAGAAPVLRPPARGAAAAESFATASGGCSSACRRGTATGPADGFIAWSWQARTASEWLVAVNYARQPGPVLRRGCRFAELAGRAVRFSDLTGSRQLRSRRRRSRRRGASISTCRPGGTTSSR